MTADLLAVLREAREFVADYLDPDSDPGLVLAQRTLDRIDSALSTPEPQGWRPTNSVSYPLEIYQVGKNFAVLYGDYRIAGVAEAIPLYAVLP